MDKPVEVARRPFQRPTKTFAMFGRGNTATGSLVRLVVVFAVWLTLVSGMAIAG